MSHKDLDYRLRSERRKWGLTQSELALLLSVRGAPQISRIERGWRRAGVSHVIAASLLFNKPVSHMFPALKTRIHKELLAQAFLVFRQVEHDKRPEAKRKRQLLQEFMARGLK